MRTVRAALALLLALSIPVRAETTTDPLWYLLSTSVLTPDAKAVEAQGDESADTKGLAALQADLLVLADGFEGFRDEGQVKETLERLKPRMSPELRPFFKDRASSLDAIYRTLAVADYTWAQRFPEPPCEPVEARRKLLSGRDGLFQTEKGETSPWLVSLLGPQTEGKSAEQALDQASSHAKLTGGSYEMIRARARKLTMALASDKAVGAARSKLYCSRAAAFADLATAHRINDAGLISAARIVDQKPEESVFVVVWKNQRAAAALLKTKSGPVLVTDAAVVADTDHPNLFAYSAKQKPVELTATVVRRHPELGVAVLSFTESLSRPALELADAGPSKGEFVTAIGHTMISGLWTKTSGLVTKVGEAGFQTDAAISPELSGGPVFNEAGEVSGLLVLRPADTEEGHWPVAVPASVLVRWLDDPSFAFRAAHAEVMEDDGTAAVLSSARPIELTEAGLGAWNIPNLPPPPSVPHGVCVQNCGGGSSSGSSYSGGYSGTGGEELGKALGELGAVLILKGIPALFRGIGKLFKGSGKSGASPYSSPNIAKQAAPVKTEPPPKPPEPPKLTGLDITLTPDELLGGETLTAVATLRFSGDNPKMDGIVVTFSTVHDGKTYTARTNSAGIAKVPIPVDAAEADLQVRPFDELKREELRQKGAEAPQSLRPDRQPKTATDKVKQRAPAAFDALEREEEKLGEGENQAETVAPPDPVGNNSGLIETGAGPLPGHITTILSPHFSHTRGSPSPDEVESQTPQRESESNLGRQMGISRSLSVTAKAVAGPMGSANNNSFASVLSGNCPSGLVAVRLPPEQPQGFPGHPASIDPKKLQLLEDCERLKKEEVGYIEAYCKGDLICAGKEIIKTEYHKRGCPWRFSRPDGLTSPGPSVPLFTFKSSEYYCLPPSEARKKGLTGTFRQADDDGSSGRNSPAVDQEWRRIKEFVEKLLAQHLSKIKASYPDAKVGYRGSIAIGRKYNENVERFVDFDPNDFDLDLLIVHDNLAAKFKRTPRYSDQLPLHLGEALQEISGSLNKALSAKYGNRYRPSNFRIINRAEYEKLTPDRIPIFIGD